MLVHREYEGHRKMDSSDESKRALSNGNAGASWTMQNTARHRITRAARIEPNTVLPRCRLPLLVTGVDANPRSAFGHRRRSRPAVQLQPSGISPRANKQACPTPT